MLGVSSEGSLPIKIITLCEAGVYLQDVYLHGIYLRNVYLLGVYLLDVYLLGVYLLGVYLHGVYLHGVYLQDVYLHVGIHLGSSSKLPSNWSPTPMYFPSRTDSYALGSRTHRA